MTDASILPVMLAVDDPAIALWKASHSGNRRDGACALFATTSDVDRFSKPNDITETIRSSNDLARLPYNFSRLYPNVPTWLS